MCYLVSSLPPATNVGIRQQQMTMFEAGNAEDHTPLERAQTFAASQLLAGHTDVKLWRLVDEPQLTQAVQWPKLRNDEAS